MDNIKLTAKEYLSQAFRIDQRIGSKLEQIRSLRELAEKATATLSDLPGNPSPNRHSMENVVARMVDLESEINADLLHLLSLKHEIVTVVKCVESPELQTILELRYLCFATWEEISVALHLDIRWVHRLHIRALNEVEAIRHAEL